MELTRTICGVAGKPYVDANFYSFDKTKERYSRSHTIVGDRNHVAQNMWQINTFTTYLNAKKLSALKQPKKKTTDAKSIRCSYIKNLCLHNWKSIVFSHFSLIVEPEMFERHELLQLFSILPGCCCYYCCCYRVTR